jgi:hypothetical protein
MSVILQNGLMLSVILQNTTMMSVILQNTTMMSIILQKFLQTVACSWVEFSRVSFYEMHYFCNAVSLWSVSLIKMTLCSDMLQNTTIISIILQKFLQTVSLCSMGCSWVEISRVPFYEMHYFCNAVSLWSVSLIKMTLCSDMLQNTTMMCIILQKFLKTVSLCSVGCSWVEIGRVSFYEMQWHLCCL